MKVKDQTIVDRDMGITFSIRRTASGGMILSYFSEDDVPFNSRTIEFGRNGRMESAGTSFGTKRTK